MPEKISCPSCAATLRVPENLLGKTVKCPKCKTAFKAELEEPAAPSGVVAEPAPARRRRPAAEEPEDDGEDRPDEQENEDRPRRRRKRRAQRSRRSEEAEAAVTAPAICLMVLGGFDILLVILDLVLRLMGVAMVAAGPAGQQNAGADAGAAANMVGGIIGSVVGLCFAALIIFGGLKMKQLNGYGLAMTAAILAMLPCGNCCIIGLPLGIWALVVLNKPEVKGAFT